MRNLLTFLLAAAATSGQPATLVASYDFDNTLNALQPGAPALLALTPDNTNAFRTDTVLGHTRTVYQLDSDQPARHAGLRFRPTALLNPNSYSLEILYAISPLPTTGIVLLDAAGDPSPSGLTINSAGSFTLSRQNAGKYTYPTGQYVHLIVTVAANQARLYANGTLDLELPTEALNLTGPNPLLNIFPIGEDGKLPSARIALLRVYSHALSAEQAYTLAANPFAATTASETPSFTAAGVRNGASFSESNPISTNAFFSIFGSALCDVTGDWTGKFAAGVAPTLVNGTRVLVNDRPAFLSFTSPNQLNGVAPDGIPPGPVTVVVEKNGVRSAPVTVQATAVNPAFFVFEPRGRRYAAAQSLDFTAYIAPADLFGVSTINGLRIRPARPGDFVGVYGMGLGPTTPSLPAGAIPPVLNGGHPAIGPVQVRLGGQTVTPIYAGLANALVGVYIVSFQVPALPSGDHELIVTVNGVSSPSGVFLPVLLDTANSTGLSNPN
jgi:uncharacterized protein (TIGR03437 family)